MLCLNETSVLTRKSLNLTGTVSNKTKALAKNSQHTIVARKGMFVIIINYIIYGVKTL